MKMIRLLLLLASLTIVSAGGNYLVDEVYAAAGAKAGAGDAGAQRDGRGNQGAKSQGRNNSASKKEDMSENQSYQSWLEKLTAD